jgi:hypothetical protein
MVICREFMPYAFDIQPLAKLSPYSASHTTVILPAPLIVEDSFKVLWFLPLASAYSARASAARETDGWPITSIHIPFREESSLELLTHKSN